MADDAATTAPDEAPPAARTGVATAGPWTWQRREVEDVVSPLLMEPDSIANLEQRNLEQREWRARHAGRVSMELMKTGEYFSAAVRKIRARQAQGD